MAGLAGCSGDASSPDDANGTSGTHAQPTADPSGSPTAELPFATGQSGEGTFYTATGEGSCGYARSPKDLDVAALNTAQWNSAAYCGMCVHVVAPHGEITLRIVDSCPTCKKGDLDFSESAFAKVEDKVTGRIPITWKAVPCTVSGPVTYVTNEGSTKYWTAVQVRNHRLPILSMEIETAAGMVKAVRESWNYFILPKGNGKDGPLKVRITATTGATLDDTLPDPNGPKATTGHANF